MAATRMKLAGNVVELSAREMVTLPSSNGCRSTSRLRRLNSGSSSRKRTPWCARLISPGAGVLPPPTMPASLMVWCGERNGRVASSGSSALRRPMALQMRVGSRLSGGVEGGRVGGGHGHRQGALHRADAAIKRQLANGGEVAKLLGKQLPGGHEQAEGDGQIEAARVFAEVGRGKIDDRPAWVTVVAEVRQGTLNA